MWQRYHLAVYEALADTFGRSEGNGIAWQLLAKRVGVDPGKGEGVEYVRRKVTESDFSIVGLIAGMQKRERVITGVCVTDRELGSVPVEERDRFYPEAFELREKKGMVKYLVAEMKGRGRGPLGWRGNV